MLASPMPKEPGPAPALLSHSPFCSVSASPHFCRNRSTRPAVSTSFCRPVKNGWQTEQISTRMSFSVLRVRHHLALHQHRLRAHHLLVRRHMQPPPPHTHRVRLYLAPLDPLLDNLPTLRKKTRRKSHGKNAA